MREPNESPAGGLRFDLWMALLATWFTAGFFIDAYAHHHDAPESFFTPWHAILYTGFLASAGFAWYTAWSNRAHSRSWLQRMPAGYATSLVGSLIFLAGGLGDLVWHEVFGIEVDVEALFSPSHLLLGIGAFLMSAGPLRAAWRRPGRLDAQGWRSALPPILSLTLCLSTLTFFVQYADPFTEVWSTSSGDAAPPPSHIYAMDADGRAQERLSYALGADDSAPTWSPDGERLLFMSDSGEGYGLWTMQADGSQRQLLASREEAEFYQPAWSPDGAHIAFTLLGEQGDEHGHQHGSAEGPDSRDAHLWLMRADGSDARPLTQGERRDWNAAWSPDGSQIAFMSTVAGNSDVYSIPLGGGEARRLTDHTAEDGHPTWSPDGRQLAFESMRDGPYGIFVMSAEGGETRRLGEPDREAWSPSWSPDGQVIAFNSGTDGDVDIWRMAADGSDARNLSARPAAHDGFFNWSPDGRRIVFRSRPDSQGNRSFTSQAVGSLGIIVHTAILMGGLLLVIGRWSIPAGGLLLVIGLNSLAMAALEDEWRLVAVGLLAGLLAELLYRWLFPKRADDAGVGPLDSPLRFQALAFLMPASLFATYQLWLLFTEGLGWSVHMWTGSIVIAGLVGSLIGILVRGRAAPGLDFEPEQASGSVSKIHHIQLAMPAGQESPARDFYEGVLGIPEVPKPPALAARGGAWFERGDLKIHLGVEADFRPARKAHPALLVQGLSALIPRLLALGIELAEDDLLPGYKRIYLSDPFGNRLELLEPRINEIQGSPPKGA